jgi:Tol biopolymer transport system component
MRMLAALLTAAVMSTIDQHDSWRNNSDPPAAAFTADGRLLAFTTYLPLAEGDTDRHNDVYVLDRASSRLTFESNAGVPALTVSDARFPVISGDGRVLVYEVSGALVVRDRGSGVSRTVAFGRQPTINRDGTLIAFTSSSIDIVAGVDANGRREDVYQIDLATDEIHRISVDSNGNQAAAGQSFAPSITADGQLVAFVSMAALDGAGGNRPVVFVRDTKSGTTRRIANGWDPFISGNGGYLAYVAHGERRTETNVYVFDLHAGTTQLISRDHQGRPGNGPSANPVLSGDGRFVTFQSEASNLVPSGVAEDFNLLTDVFLFDRHTGVMERISTDATSCWMEASSGPTMDASGSLIAFSSRHPTSAADKHHDNDLYVVGPKRVTPVIENPP